MEDTDKMPFGKYKGKEMAEVPAGYLLWFRDNVAYAINPQIHDYIDDNIDVLRKELKEQKLKRKNNENSIFSR